jgi:hypothetical protein
VFPEKFFSFQYFLVGNIFVNFSNHRQVWIPRAAAITNVPATVTNNHPTQKTNNHPAQKTNNQTWAK